MRSEENDSAGIVETGATAQKPDLPEHSVQPGIAIVDLVIFLGMMFFIRTIGVAILGFWGNVLLNSLTTVGVATLLLYFRGQTWKSLGLTKPESYSKMLAIVALTLIGTVASIMVFEIFIRDLLTEASIASPAPDTRFQELRGNLPYFFSIIGFVLIESFLEELQDRGFSFNRLESLFSKIPLSVVFAVLIQAAIFGFRHSGTHGITGAITAGIIGLVFGISYIVSGRNIWPVVIAHCLLNTMSMVERI